MKADLHRLERLRFAPGQDLLSRDFRDQETFEARRREWHNRALHQVFGVSFGLRVDLASGVFGVEVRPGLAYDATGRALVLRRPRTVAYPIFADPQLLVLRRGGDLRWVPERELRPCDAVPIARIVVDQADPLDQDFRPPAARPLTRPHIGHGSTLPGGTTWQAELVSDSYTSPPLDDVVALLFDVDTHAAGFTGLPRYFAWLQGGLRFPIEVGGQKSLVPLPLHPSIEAETPLGFRFRVLVVNPLFALADPSVTIPDFRRWVLATAQQTLALCWLGLEKAPAPPSFSEVNDGNP